MLRLSIYFSSVKLDDDLYAIFNRLYFKILYVREFELKKILNYDIDMEILSLMIDYYIYILQKKWIIIFMKKLLSLLQKIVL